MPKSSPAKLAFQKQYNALPGNVIKREKENLARAHAIKAGKVKRGDGKDVDHIVPLDNGGSAADSNTRVTTQKTNRGWRKGQSGYDPSLQKK